MTSFSPSFEYEPSADAVIVKLRPEGEIVKTVEIDDARFVDLNRKNQVVEIEVLWASTGVEFGDLVDRFDLSDFKPFLEEVSLASQAFKPRSFA